MAALGSVGPSRRHTSRTSAPMIRSMVQTSVSTYCSSTSCSGSKSTGIVASAASQVRAPNRMSTAYTRTAVASPARCCVTGMSHRSCSAAIGMIRTE